MNYQKSIPKKHGIKRAWCKKKLRHLFTILISRNNARVENTSKTLQLNKAYIFCSAIILIIVAVRPAKAMTPIIMIGNNASETVKRAERTCTLLCKVAVVLGKFPSTKEGRTALIWLALSGLGKGFSAANMLASPTYGTASIAIALFCSAAYSIETLVGSETFVGAKLLNHANNWCVNGYTFLSAAAIVPKETFNYAIKVLEAMKSVD
tara:strand:- start:1557 stop:2180 length:624 start_codon:yes stop_codon:yes gene_type:complete